MTPLGATGWLGEPPKEICIVMLSAIGDAVHVLPVANALKRAWPDARITWVIQEVPWTMVRNHPAIDDFIVFRRRRGMRGIDGFVEVRDQLRSRRFDLLLGLQVYLKAGVITAMADARVKLGFDRARARDAQWLFTTHRIPAAGQHHVQDQYLEFVSALGIDEAPAAWGLDLTEDERAAQADFFSALDRPACAIVLGTSKPEKNWNAAGYAEVADALSRRYGLQPVLIGGPSALERQWADDVMEATEGPVVDALGDDLRKLMWIIDGSALVLSPDTGPLHIARAMDVPCVSLFGYTNPKRTGPWRAFEDLVVDGYAHFPGEDYPLAPVYRRGMERITVDDVLTKVSLAVERYVSRRVEGRKDG
ncbi:MAG: glycosyltransferase family 9 protein [Gemmatimonadota bacterium]